MSPRARSSCFPALALLVVGGARQAPQEGERSLPSVGGLDLEAGLEDLTGRGLAFVGIELERDTFLLGEPFLVRLRFGFESAFLRTSVVQPFRRTLDVPAQVEAAWLEALPGARALVRPETPLGVSVAVGEDVQRCSDLGESVRDGVSFRVFEITRRYQGTRPGALVLEAPSVRFAYATAFRDDFVQGRVPEDRHDALVRGTAARLAIAPPPEEGRPEAFTGAVGRFEMEVEALPRTLAVGQDLTLTLRLRAEDERAPLDPALAPHLDAPEGFDLRGRLVTPGPGSLELRLDLAPRSADVRAVPPIRFAYFDLTPPAGYRTLESAPLALEVRPGPASTHRTSTPAPEPPRAQRPGMIRGLVALVAGLLVGLVLALARRRRKT